MEYQRPCYTDPSFLQLIIYQSSTTPSFPPFPLPPFSILYLHPFWSFSITSPPSFISPLTVHTNTFFRYPSEAIVFLEFSFLPYSPYSLFMFIFPIPHRSSCLLRPLQSCSSTRPNLPHQLLFLLWLPQQEGNNSWAMTVCWAINKQRVSRPNPIRLSLSDDRERTVPRHFPPWSAACLPRSQSQPKGDIS